MRTTLLATAILGFAGLGLLDLFAGNYRLGVAALALAFANYLLLAT